MIRVPIARPLLGAEETEAVARVIRSRWVTQGPEVAAFESELAKAVGAAHAVAVSNGTVALELALRVVGVAPGDEVATVSHSFIATANSVLAVGAKPVFVDVDERDYGMDPRRLEASLSPRTKAILAVHQLGFPCDLEALLAIGAKHGLPVVEDAACAIGSELEVGGRSERIGRPHGALACFSFHPRKIVTTGDGGMITTSDAALAERLRRLRHHGMSIADTTRHAANEITFEEYVEPAFNHRLTDLQAAMGRAQLARLEGMLAERRRLAAEYARVLEKNPVLAPHVARAGTRPNWQSYPATLRAAHRRDQVAVMKFFLERGVATKRGVSNAHQEPAYRDPALWRMGAGGLAVSERLRDEVVLLPLFNGMTEEEEAAVLAACEALAREGPLR